MLTKFFACPKKPFASLAKPQPVYASLRSIRINVR
jgi:hypothetical protein